MGADQRGADPRPAAVSFATTEHFTLQGARAATIAESTGRATMFLGAAAALASSGTVFIVAFGALMRYQHAAWARAVTEPLIAIAADDAQPAAPEAR
jgi:hypothetical protein